MSAADPMTSRPDPRTGVPEVVERVRLTDAEKQHLAKWVLGGAEPSTLMVTAVEHIVAARVAEALAAQSGDELTDAERRQIENRIDLWRSQIAEGWTNPEPGIGAELDTLLDSLVADAVRLAPREADDGLVDGRKVTTWERCWDSVADAAWPANNASRAYVLDLLLSVHPDPSLAADLNPFATQADDGLAERVKATTRVEWAVQKRSYPLGTGIRLYGDDEAGARAAAPKVIGEGAFPICRTVTEFAPVVSEWSADEPCPDFWPDGRHLDPPTDSCTCAQPSATVRGEREAFYVYCGKCVRVERHHALLATPSTIVCTYCGTCRPAPTEEPSS